MHQCSFGQIWDRCRMSFTVHLTFSACCWSCQVVLLLQCTLAFAGLCCPHTLYACMLRIGHDGHVVWLQLTLLTVMAQLLCVLLKPSNIPKCFARSPAGHMCCMHLISLPDELQQVRESRAFHVHVFCLSSAEMNMHCGRLPLMCCRCGLQR